VLAQSGISPPTSMQPLAKLNIRQELAKTRKQVTIRIQDVKILTNQIESEEAIRQGEMEQFEKLESAVEPNEAYATPDSRAIFG
jgi:hypothetical protein